MRAAEGDVKLRKEVSEIERKPGRKRDVEAEKGPEGGKNE
jgi:hypothetical protein